MNVIGLLAIDYLSGDSIDIAVALIATTILAYPTRADYLAKVTQCVFELKRQRFLLDEDVANLLHQAGRQGHWDK